MASPSSSSSSSSSPSPSSFFRDLAERHEALKKRIHATRIPIRSRIGLFGVGCIYFVTPLVGGYFVFRWTERLRDENLGGPGREKLLAAKKRWAGEDGGTPHGVVVRKDTPVPRRVVGPPAKEL